MPLFASLVGLACACATAQNSTEHGPSYEEDAGDSSMPDVTPGDDAEPGSESGNPQDSSTGTEGGTTVDSAIADTGPPSFDTGTPPIDGGSCSSTMALLGMGASSLAEATFSGGTWSSATLVVQGGAASPALPALVPFSGGYLGAFVTNAAQLDSTLDTTSWSAPSRVGTGTAQGTPALAVSGSSGYAAYWGGDGKYYLDTYSGGWSTSSVPIGPDGGVQSFGSSPPAAAAVASSVIMVQSGTDNNLYTQTWTAGTWQTASPIAGASVVATLSPAVVALQGGTADLLIVFVRLSDDHLMFTTRTSGTWSAPAEVYDTGGNIAYSGFTPTLAALPGGGAMVVWQGGNNEPYESTYSSAGGWGAPANISTMTVMSAPTVAQGVCGASASVAFVATGGQVDVTSLTGSTWSAPTAIAGATGMQSVQIASTP